MSIASEADRLLVRRERQGLAFGLVAAVIWGGYIAVTHHGMGAGLLAADLAFLRFAIAGLILLPWFIRNDPARLAGLGWLMRRAPSLEDAFDVMNGRRCSAGEGFAERPCVALRLSRFINRLYRCGE